MKTVIKKYNDVPFVSGSLVAINVIVYIICSLTGQYLYTMGGLSAFEVIFKREYGRIIWSMFLHSDVNHVFNNMLLLLFMGSMIEKEVGHLFFGIFYFLSGIGGNVCSLLYKLLTNDLSHSIGASGAVFGLDGVLFALVVFGGKRMATVTPVRVGLMILLSLYSGFSGQRIDNTAHVGGLLTGFLLGTIRCIVCRRKTRKDMEDAATKNEL